MKITLSISATAGILMGASSADIATTTSGVDEFYDNLDCTGVPVFVRLYPSCENSQSEVEAVCDSYDSRKTFCVPNEAEYFGDADPYVVIESYDDANCLEVGGMTHAYLADGRCHEYKIDEHGAAYSQLTTVDEDGMVIIYPGCNTSETPEFQQPATSFNTDNCVPVDFEGYVEGYSKYYLVNLNTSGDASGSAGAIYTPPIMSADASRSTSATDTDSAASGSTIATTDAPSATTPAPTTTTTGSASLATPTPIVCSVAILLASTVLLTVAAF